MKILHFSTHYRISTGIIKQLSYENAATRNHPGIMWHNAVFTCLGKQADFILKTKFTNNKLINYLYGRIHSIFWLSKNAKKYDIILLRHNLGDPFELIAIFFMKKFVTIHHTLELDEALSMKTRTGKIQYFLEKYLGQMILRRSAGIIGVTGEIVAHELSRVSVEKPYHIYPNGIDLEMTSTCLDKRDGIPKFLFVAAIFSAWHGLDKLLTEAFLDNRECEIHVVGNCNIEDIRRMKCDPRFIYHGELSTPEILELSSGMDIGISSLALERNGLQEACTLKVREYLASGLPVFSGHIDAALPEGFPYYRIAPPTIQNICTYALSLRTTSRLSVREAARPFINKNQIVASLINWFQHGFTLDKQ